LLASLLMTVAVYAPGLHGGWLFDDYPNIVDNHGVQPTDAKLGTLVGAALSSPSSEFKRPLASLSFALNYLATGLNPYWMKLTNLLIHLINGLLVFLLARRLLSATQTHSAESAAEPPDRDGNYGVLAALIAAAWLVLPINLTGVLYVVQRMESMANVFVLLGLVGYVAGRQRMLLGHRGLAICVISVTVPTALGLLAKETAVMLPLYAFLTEWLVFGFRGTSTTRDGRVLLLFALVLALPMVIGLAWIVPHVLSPTAFSTRDFTLQQRLLSEMRIVTDYIGWTLIPSPDELSFYHDDFRVSTGLFHPWTTFTSLLVLIALAWAVLRMRRSHPLIALGLALYLGCHLLTGTILPLELIYEHRNYFASFGLLLAAIPVLVGSTRQNTGREMALRVPFRLVRYAILACLGFWWTGLTFLTSKAWGDPLHLAEELAARAPESPRAQYELGRTYIIYSHYDPESPFTRLAYAPLEQAMSLPESSILPEQALIFMNARMQLPISDTWWDSMIKKLKARRPGVQDESSLGALVQCARGGQCELPKQRMIDAFLAALSHPNPSPRLLAAYGDYAWNVLGEKELAERMAYEAVKTSPDEPAYRITVIRMLVARGQYGEAREALKGLEALNFGGRLNGSIAELRALLPPS
jgi:hypothetical protein